MIHIATVHWQTGTWIPIQQLYLQKNIPEGFITYAVLSPGLERVHFDYHSISCGKDHANHLNHLLKVVLKSDAKDDDILVFLDGDAFPVAPLYPYLEKALIEHPLVALERRENAGEFIPHPGFCAAHVGWWKETGVQWGQGSYTREFGKDPGGRLFEELNKKDIQWRKMLRSNTTNLHPLFFGVYENIIYHHGAGFREPISRIDMENENLKSKYNHPVSRLMELLPNSSFLKLKRMLSPYRREEYRIILKNSLLQSEVFSQIRENEAFYKQFI